MVLYLREDGTLEVYSSENINQGSVNANRIDILSKLSQGVMFITFTLPNGQPTTPIELTETGISDGFHLWTMTMPAELTAYAGNLRVQLLYTVVGATLASTVATFTIKRGTAYVMPSASDNEWNTILNVLASINAERLEAEGYATGDQDGEPVEPGSQYYENNAKYYSEQAEESAQDAEANVTAVEELAGHVDAFTESAFLGADESKRWASGEHYAVNLVDKTGDFTVTVSDPKAYIIRTKYSRDVIRFVTQHTDWYVGDDFVMLSDYGLDYSGAISDGDYFELQTVIEDVTSGQPGYHDNSKYYKDLAKDYKDSAETSALVSEGYAVGTQNGADVGSSSPYYHNNAKYYSDNADEQASNAEGYSESAYNFKEQALGAASSAIQSAQTASQYLDEMDAKYSAKQDKKPDGTNDLIQNGKVAMQYIPDGIVGQVAFQGTWNASTGTPKKPYPSATKEGFYWICSAPGTKLPNGVETSIYFETGDWAIIIEHDDEEGDTWDKVDNTDAVHSVNGYIGDVVAKASGADIYGVEYDSIDGAVFSGEFHTLNADGEEDSVNATLNLPIIPGEGMTIEADDDREHLIVKPDLDVVQRKLPTVVNDRYLHTNATTGALEWSEVQQGSVVLNSASHVTLGDSQHTVVPALSSGQVVSAFNALVAGNIAIIHDAYDNVDTLVTERATIGNNASISCTYLGRLVLTYTVNNSSTVDLTFREISAHQITSVTVGTDTIDVVIS